MSENVIIAIIGTVGTLIGAIVGTIGSVLIAKMNRPPQEQNAPLPPSPGSSKIKVACITAVVGLGAGLLISFWIFSGKSSHSQENGAVTPVINVSDPIPAQKEVASATPIPKAASASNSAQTQEAAPIQESASKEEKEKPKPAPKEEKEKPKPAPKEEKEKPKPEPKEGPAKKKK